MQGRLRAGRARLLWASWYMMGMREERSDGRGDEGSMQEGFQPAGLFGVDGVEAVHRRVEPDAEFHLPAHAGEVGHLPWPDPWGEIGQEKTIPFRGLHSHQPQGQGVAPPAHMDIGVYGAAIQDQRLVVQQGIEVGPGKELLRDR
jgi:hypothetical protein